MALQVAVDHEHLVASRVGTGPLADLLVVLLYVLLWGTVTLSAQLGLMAPAAAPGRNALPTNPARLLQWPHLHAIGPSVHCRAALVGTLVDGGQLLPATEHVRGAAAPAVSPAPRLTSHSAAWPSSRASVLASSAVLVLQASWPLYLHSS